MAGTLSKPNQMISTFPGLVKTLLQGLYKEHSQDMDDIICTPAMLGDYYLLEIVMRPGRVKGKSCFSVKIDPRDLDGYRFSTGQLVDKLASIVHDWHEWAYGYSIRKDKTRQGPGQDAWETLCHCLGQIGLTFKLILDDDSTMRFSLLEMK